MEAKEKANLPNRLMSKLASAPTEAKKAQKKRRKKRSKTQTSYFTNTCDKSISPNLSHQQSYIHCSDPPNLCNTRLSFTALSILHLVRLSNLPRHSYSSSTHDQLRIPGGRTASTSKYPQLKKLSFTAHPSIQSHPP